MLFFLAHLAMTALRADSLRCSGVIADALASPPSSALLAQLGEIFAQLHRWFVPTSRVYTKAAFVFQAKISLDIRRRPTYSSGHEHSIERQTSRDHPSACRRE